MRSTVSASLVVAVTAFLATGAHAHGGMTRPVARNVIGKYFKAQYPGVPTNYDWNALYVMILQDFCRLNVQRCTAMGWVLIPAYCSANS